MKMGPEIKVYVLGGGREGAGSQLCVCVCVCVCVFRTTCVKAEKIIFASESEFDLQMSVL
jgi:hypothetical protein